MTTFVNEHINQLNRSLSTLFTPPPSFQSQHASNPEAALEKNDQQLFLTLASQDIDLSQQVLPKVQIVQKYLELYNTDGQGSSLDWLFLSKCTVALYGVLLDRVLNSTLPLSQSVTYWNNLYGSSLREAYYALQSKLITMRCYCSDETNNTTD